MNARILVVDDEESIREIVRRALGDSGYTVETAADADEAGRRLPEGWDLVLTDVAMPGSIDGLELLLRAKRSRGTEVVVMTGHPSVDSAAKALRGRADDYLIKPFTVEELSASVRLALERRRRAAEVDRLLSPEVADLLAQPPPEEARTREVTVLFADARGFTPLTQRVGEAEAARALNAVLAAVADAVMAHGGTVNKFTGDGILALFGAPAPHADGPWAAARAALDAVARVESEARRREASGLPALRIGCALNTGPAAAGYFGSAARAEYGVAGHAVNVAARLQEEALAGEVLAGPASAESLKGRCPLEARGNLALKGVSGPVAAWRLLDPAT